ncbi:hypothetical protein [Bacillus subtilis]
MTVISFLPFGNPSRFPNKRQACCSLPMDWRLYPANRSRMESG